MLKSLNTLLLISCGFFSAAQAGKKLIRSGDSDVLVNTDTKAELMLKSSEELIPEIKSEPLHLFTKIKRAPLYVHVDEKLCDAERMSREREVMRYFRSKTIGGRLLAQCEKKISAQNYDTVVELLVQATFEDLALQDDFYKQTVLHHIVQANIDEQRKIVLIELAKRNGADFNAQDWYGNTPLHSAIISKQSCEIISALIQAGSEINAQNNDQRIPLHHVGVYGGMRVHESIQALIKAGGDIYWRDKYGTTPMSKFEKYYSQEFVQAIVALQE